MVAFGHCQSPGSATPLVPETTTNTSGTKQGRSDLTRSLIVQLRIWLRTSKCLQSVTKHAGMWPAMARSHRHPFYHINALQERKTKGRCWIDSNSRTSRGAARLSTFPQPLHTSVSTDFDLNLARHTTEISWASRFSIRSNRVLHLRDHETHKSSKGSHLTLRWIISLLV